MIDKKTRKQVYDKYNGHCAYCGCEMAIKDMQIDHLVSQFSSVYHGNQVDNSLGNLMPSCRQCNYYKQTLSLEEFRHQVGLVLSETWKKSFVVRLAMKYGMAIENKWDGKFYFEKNK
jgi:5-methylcytosine-specific restriction endonuclease McrA